MTVIDMKLTPELEKQIIIQYCCGYYTFEQILKHYPITAERLDALIEADPLAKRERETSKQIFKQYGIPGFRV